jgi:hypothetical protein
MTTPPPSPTVKTREELDRMSAAEKLDYARLWDQTKMPAWQDPRK